MAGRTALPASGNTTIASTPWATRPWMSEIAFWVLPWPSVYTYFVTLGHFLASFWASPLVTLRQLLSPNPSARASVIFFEPHQDGAPATGLPAAALLEPPPPPPPQATTPNASAAQAILTPIVPLVLMRTRLSSLLVDTGPPFGPPLAQSSPRH